MQEIGTLVPGFLKAHLRASQPRVAEILATFWQQVVGKAVASESRPVAYSSRSLTLATASPSWTVELLLLQDQLRAQINRFLGGPIVQKLRVRYAPELFVKSETSKLESGNSKLETGKWKRGTGNWKLETEPIEGWNLNQKSLEPEVARIVERSFTKYFSRPGW